MSSLREKGSIWEARHAGEAIGGFFPKLGGDTRCDVCIIGAGITGVTLAYELAKNGVDVVLIDSDRIGAGATGATTAHLDPYSDRYISDLLNSHGVAKTQSVIESGLEAIRRIEDISKMFGIECGLKRIEGSYIAETHEEMRFLEKEQEASLKFGLSAELKVEPKGPFKAQAMLTYKNMAQFDPLAFLYPLAKAAKRLGCRIFQQTMARDIDATKVETDGATIRANHVVMATHTPLGFHPVLQGKVFPFQSYVIGAQIKEDLPEALFWDMKDPYHYIRRADFNGQRLCLIGGADHRTGTQAQDPYGALQAFGRKHFTIENVEFAWSSQFFKSADGLPYIGRVSKDQKLWFATGYEGNGMVFGVVAATILSDLIQDNVNEYTSVYDPHRLNLALSGRRLLKENLVSAKDFIKDRMEKPEGGLESVRKGEGKIISHEGNLTAAYKDDSGAAHLLSPVCTHAKCHVRWNEHENTWDCPCHGGRFKATGQVLSGPPTEALKNIVPDAEISDEKNKRPSNEGPMEDSAN